MPINIFFSKSCSCLFGVSETAVLHSVYIFPRHVILVAVGELKVPCVNQLATLIIYVLLYNLSCYLKGLVTDFSVLISLFIDFCIFLFLQKLRLCVLVCLVFLKQQFSETAAT